MIGYGVISSYEGNRTRVLSYDVPGHITPPLVIPGYFNEQPGIGVLVAYAEFEKANTGAVLAVMEEGA